MKSRFTARSPLLWILVALTGVLTALAVEPGTARINVIQELGTPLSAIARGDTEVITYKDGVKITLLNGRVTEVRGKPKPVAAPEPMTPPAAVAKPSTEAAKPAPAPAKPAATADPAEAVEALTSAPAGQEWAAAQAKHQAEMEKAVTDLENLSSPGAALPPPPAFNLVAFLIGLVLKWLLTLAALKLTCKYWGCEIFWSGLMTVAVVDVAVRGLISGAGALLGFFSVFYADEAVAAIVMVLVLRKVSINQSLAQAVQITMTCKVFSIVVGSFLLTALMQVLR